MANRMQRLVQLGKEGLVPPPFSIPNPNLNISDKINIQEINTIYDDDSLLDDTYVEPLRHANRFDYEILGMHENLIPIPDTVNAGVQTIGENIVQYEEIIHEGKENQEPSSHSICLNEGSDFSAGSGDEYKPPRRDRSSSTSSSIVSSNIKRGKKSQIPK
ncbi:unnamed protein product [Parnassius apollo]|uniref:(apollo) hypothetical protein n=1 Tax=Parnassius apollo TaxID=110799 RepID=A0A8S3XC60_PARAO|nr:unnamed protein product [Parnassius apollo]